MYPLRFWCSYLHARSAGPVHDSGLENGNLPLSNVVAYDWLEEAI